MSDFSLTLNEDQLQIQKWVHEFAENVVRPAGPEWDEREETPWPIIKEAAKNGLYSFDFVAQCFADPTGLLLCLVTEDPHQRNPHARLSVTYPVINAARNAVFTVAGPEKHEAIERIRSGENLPAARVASVEIRWLVDVAASKGGPSW